MFLTEYVPLKYMFVYTKRQTTHTYFVLFWSAFIYVHPLWEPQCENVRVKEQLCLKVSHFLLSTLSVHVAVAVVMCQNGDGRREVR